MWLVLGDLALDRWVEDQGWRLRLNLVLDLVFVVTAALLLRSLLSRLVRRKAAIQASEHSVRWMQTLIESSHDAIFAKDRQGRYLLVNREAGRVMGRKPDDLLGVDDHVAFPEQAAMLLANDQLVMEQDQVQTFEEHIQTAVGPRTYQALKGPLRDEAGQVIGMYGVSRDITEQHAAQAQLQDNEKRYRLMFEANPLPMMVFELKGLRILAVNEAAVAHYGYAREEFLGLTLKDIRPPEEHERFSAEIARRREAPQPPLRSTGRWTHRCKDGRLVLMDVSSIAMDFDGQPARLALCHDVTQQVDLERARQNAYTEIEKTRDLLTSVLERVDDGFVALDKRGFYTYVNAQAARMLGVASPKELVGRHIWTVFPQSVGTTFYDACARAAKTQQAVVLEEYFEPRGRWFETRIYPSPEGLSYFISDVTERKQAEQVLSDRERDFRLLAEQTPALIYRAALDGSNRTLYVSPHIEVLGFTPEQWLANSDSWAQAVHPDDLERVREALPTATSAVAEVQIEYRLRDAQGRWRHFRDSSRRIQPDGGGAPYLQGVSIDISELIEAEQALLRSQDLLRESEQRYRLAAAHGLVWDWDVTSDQLNIGGDFWLQLGMAAGPVEQSQARFEEVLHADDIPAWRQAIRAFVVEHKPYFFQFRVTDAQGRLRWFETQGSGLRDEADRVRYMAGTTVEITQRVEAVEALQRSEAQLRESEQRYRLAAAGGQVWDWEPDTGRLTVGDDFWHQLGWAPEPSLEVVARLVERIHPLDLPVWRRVVREHLLQRKPYDIEYRIQDAQGGWRWLHTKGQAVWNADGRATYMAGTTVDITERKRAQAELQASEAYRRKLFEQLSDGVLLVDSDNRIQDANPQVLAMLGLGREALLARPLTELLAEQERSRIERLFSGETQLSEWAFLRQDGSQFPVEVSARALDDRHFLAVLRDISARRASENALFTYQLELSELTHQLLVQEKQTSRRIAQALHDRLGQTLAVIRLHLDAAVSMSGDAMPPNLKKQCGRIDGLLDQAVHEVRDVLSELRPPLLEEQGLTVALDNEVSAPAVDLKGVDVLLEVDDDVAQLKWPPEVEYGAFMVAREALANALLHAEASLIRVVLSGHANQLHLDVIDDGRGIPAPMTGGRPGHLGVVGMRERAIAIGAQFSVTALPQGTRVSLHWEGPTE
ncbi:PAS domain S-box protein [Hydrogenophaga sp.]|uniref:PAS domain S-box protein n=1 Tax=Hydrogenophaga sp. TaxID=1904254 RepID=UPI0035626B1B